ncbi:MAG: energy-coupling factor ABC transporter ATP-binding protein [Anaerolineales bacterium]
MIRLHADDVWFSYPDHEPALRGANLIVEPGEFLAIIGQNGSGKSTLAKHLNGLLRPEHGTIMHDGASIGKRSTGELAHDVGYVFQNPDHMLFSPTVEEELASGPRYQGKSETEVSDVVRETLREFGLAETAKRGPASLDFGTRRSISVAAAIAARPKALILDEPTLGLDWGKAIALMNIVRARHRAGHSVLLITHDMRLVARYAHKLALMKDGIVAAEDETLQILTDQELLASSQIRPPQVIELAQLLGLGQFTVESLCAALSDR